MCPSYALTMGRAVTRREEPRPRGAMTENGLYVIYAPEVQSIAQRERSDWYAGFVRESAQLTVILRRNS